MIEFLLKNNPDLKHILQFVDEESCVEEVYRQFSNLFDSRVLPKYEHDFSRMPLGSIVTLLDDFFGPEYNDSYYLVWNNNRDCVVVRIKSFATYFEDLFFPGRDNLFLMATDKSFYVYISHEEELKIYRSS